MNILVTGASGLLGTALNDALTAAGHRVLPLRRRQPGTGPSWDPDSGQIDLAPAGALDAVVHLAGESIAQRWTPAAKQRIRHSRVAATRLLCEALNRLPAPPQVFIGASAIGYYGDRGDAWMDESSSVGTGFLAGLTQEWEAAADSLRGRTRLVHARIGIVLSRRGGALAKLLTPFRLGVGGPVGDGSQYWSWIALEDLLAVFLRALADNCWSGPINVVAPGPVTSREFARVLGRVLRRPAVMPLPRFVVEWVFGEMGREALLGSTRVRPAFLLEHGFPFQQATLESALRAELMWEMNR